jgi:hypothetical protein
LRLCDSQRGVQVLNGTLFLSSNTHDAIYSVDMHTGEVAVAIEQHGGAEMEGMTFLNLEPLGMGTLHFFENTSPKRMFHYRYAHAGSRDAALPDISAPSRPPAGPRSDGVVLGHSRVPAPRLRCTGNVCPAGWTKGVESGAACASVCDLDDAHACCLLAHASTHGASSGAPARGTDASTASTIAAPWNQRVSHEVDGSEEVCVRVCMRVCACVFVYARACMCVLVHVLASAAPTKRSYPIGRRSDHEARRRTADEVPHAPPHVYAASPRGSVEQRRGGGPGVYASGRLVHVGSAGIPPAPLMPTSRSVTASPRRGRPRVAMSSTMRPT